MLVMLFINIFRFSFYKIKIFLHTFHKNNKKTNNLFTKLCVRDNHIYTYKDFLIKKSDQLERLTNINQYIFNPKTYYRVSIFIV